MVDPVHDKSLWAGAIAPITKVFASEGTLSGDGNESREASDYSDDKKADAMTHQYDKEGKEHGYTFPALDEHA